MIRIIIALISTLLLSLGIFWLAQNSGKITVNLLNYHIEMEFYAFCIILIIALIAIFLIFTCIMRLLALPLQLTKLFKTDALKCLEELMINIANGNHQRSLKLFNQLQKANLPPAMLRLLQAEVTMLSNDIPAQKAIFAILINDPQTHNIGLEGMLDLAQQEDNLPLILEYSLMLFNGGNSNAFVEFSIINVYIALQQWQKLIDFLRNNKLILNKQIRNSLLGIAYYKHAEEEFLANEFTNAERCLIEAERYLNKFLPIEILHIKIAEVYQDAKKILYFVKRAWSVEPQYEVANYFFKLKDTMSPDQYLKTAQKIANENYNHYESHMLLAKSALEVDNITLAEQEITASLSTELRFRACLLMAEFCYKVHGNASEMLEWVQKAVYSKLDVCYKCFYFDMSNGQFSTEKNDNSFLITKI